MAKVVRVWPPVRRPYRLPDILKSSSAKSQCLCMNCHFCGHANTEKCHCGYDLIGLNNKVRAPKKGSKTGWRELILAYAWWIHRALKEIYPCPELTAYESKCALGHRDDWKEREKILRAWVLTVDAEFQKNRNKK